MESPRELLEKTVALCRDQDDYTSLASDQVLAASAEVLDEALRDQDRVDVEALATVVWLYCLRQSMLPGNETIPGSDIGIGLTVAAAIMRIDDVMANTLLPDFLVEMVQDMGLDNAASGALALIIQDVSVEPIRTRVSKLALLLSAVLAKSARDKRKSYALLAGFNHNQFTRSSRIEDLEECVANLRQATVEAELDPSDRGPKALDLDNLGTMLYLMFDATEELDFIRESVSFHEKALSLSVVGDTQRVQTLDNLGASMQILAEATNDPAMLRTSLDAYRKAIGEAREGSSEQWIVIDKLWRVLRLVPRVCGIGQDLTAALEEGQNLIMATGQSDPHYADHLGIMAELNLYRYRLDKEARTDSIDKTVTYLRLARDASSAADLAMASNELGASLIDRFRQTGVLADLEEAVACLESPLGSDLGSLEATERRSLEVIRRRNLRNALKLLEQANAGPISGPAQKESELRQVTAFAGELLGQFTETRESAYIDRAIEVAENVTELDGGPAYRDLNCVLVKLWVERAQVTGQPAHLDHALELAGYLSERTGGDSEITIDLGNIYRIRFELRGDLDDINRAINTLHGVLDIDMDSGLRRQLRSRLGLALTRRYEHTNDMSDLRRAVAVLQDAADETVGEDLDRSYNVLGSALDNLGTAYKYMYDRTDDVDLLTACIDSINRSVELATGLEITYGVRLDNLAFSLLERFGISENVDDLYAALEAAEKAVDATPKGRVDRFRKLRTLSLILFAKFRITEDPLDLRLAVAKGQASVKACPRDHSGRGEILVLFAENLYEFCHEPGREDFVELGLTLTDEARRSESSFLKDRCRAAMFWAYFASINDLPAAVGAAGDTFRLLAAMDWHGLQITDRLSLLRGWSRFAAEAASWALDSADLPSAVRLLEEGRGLLWSQFTDIRSELDNIPVADLLVEELKTIQVSLSELAAGGARDAVQRGDALIRLNARRRRILTEIRKIPELSDFLAPPSLPLLAKAACKGPVVILNISRRRCDAIVVQQREGEINIECVNLGKLTFDVIAQRILSLYQALEDASSARNYLLLDRSLGRTSPRSMKVVFATALDQLERVLAWGWENITEPVLSSLGYVSQPESAECWPRIWWCPTGVLALLPLHATGYHDGSGRAVIDRVISSEATTLRALAHSYATSTLAEVRLPALLAVAVAQPAGTTRSLAGVAAELDEIDRLATVPVTRLEDGGATRDRILSLIPSHSWFHFAGHGSNSITSPDDAALSANDRPVTLSELAETVHRGAELAFLSTCYGAMPSLEHLDEALHLAGAFNAIGFQHVIASKYPLLDEVAWQFTSFFFEQLPDVRDPGLALHHAVRSVRERLTAARRTDDLVHPFEWIGHTHLGPARSVF